MKRKPLLFYVSVYILHIIFTASCCLAHDIIFCGERIPVDNNVVADKLMNVIRRQIPYVNLPQLRKRVEQNFPVVEYYLRETGLPEDFKYLAIVESGFQHVTSTAGARGFWQLMPETARELGLAVTPAVDERDNIYKSTYAACKVLAAYYLKIKKLYGVSSWVLTAAAYNFGIGNMNNVINRQGNDYFTMNLNPETAVYVYKIIAVKELFENPELYMNDFGYNVFNVNSSNPGNKINNANADTSMFKSMVIKVSEKDGQHPDKVIVKEQGQSQNMGVEETKTELDRNKYKYLAASIKGRYKHFEDGNLVTIELLENLNVHGNFSRKGNQLKGKGWFIGDRIYIDLGYGDHDVTLLDINGKKGILLTALKNNEPILLKITNSNN